MFSRKSSAFCLVLLFSIVSTAPAQDGFYDNLFLGNFNENPFIEFAQPDETAFHRIDSAYDQLNMCIDGKTVFRVYGWAEVDALVVDETGVRAKDKLNIVDDNGRGVEIAVPFFEDSLRITNLPSTGVGSAVYINENRIGVGSGDDSGAETSISSGKIRCSDADFSAISLETEATNEFWTLSNAEGFHGNLRLWEFDAHGFQDGSGFFFGHDDFLGTVFTVADDNVNKALLDPSRLNFLNDNNVNGGISLAQNDIVFFGRANKPNPAEMLKLENDNGVFMSLKTAANNWTFLNDRGGRFVVSVAGTGGPEFTLRPDGGLKIGPGGAANFDLLADGNLTIAGTLNQSSDRNLKKNFSDVDHGEVLCKVLEMPVTTWQYKKAEGEQRHMGPMAQDFYAAFQLGASDKTISTADSLGVSLAAIKGLNGKVTQLVEQKDEQIAELQEQLRKQQLLIESMLERLETVESN